MGTPGFLECTLEKISIPLSGGNARSSKTASYGSVPRRWHPVEILEATFRENDLDSSLESARRNSTSAASSDEPSMSSSRTRAAFMGAVSVLIGLDLIAEVGHRGDALALGPDLPPKPCDMLIDGA